MIGWNTEEINVGRWEMEIVRLELGKGVKKSKDLLSIRMIGCIPHT